MVEDRLKLIAPELSDRLRNASSENLHTVKLAVCRFALDRAQYVHPLLDTALLSLKEKKPISGASLEELKILASSLDDKYFELDAAWQEDSAVDRTAALTAFRQARIANAIYFAAQGDSFETVAECIYEANSAVEDIEGIRGSVLNVFG